MNNASPRIWNTNQQPVLLISTQKTDKFEDFYLHHVDRDILIQGAHLSASTVDLFIVLEKGHSRKKEQPKRAKKLKI